MKTHSKISWLGATLVAGLVALAPTADADRPKTAMADAKVSGKAELSLDTIVAKHLDALGGAELLRATKSMSYVSSGEKAGKKFTKTVHFARPGKMRVDFVSDEATGSKGFDGKAGWVKKSGEAVIAMTAEQNASMKFHADFDEPLLDYAKRGTKVKLVGLSEVAGTPAYELKLALANGEVERHFIDAATFLPLKKTWAVKKDGKEVSGWVKFGDFRKVQGRMVNHSIEFHSEGVTGRGTVSNVVFDKPIDGKLFAMPR